LKFRGLDSNGDWMLGQGLGSYAKESAALALNIQTRILSWYGNCFFAMQDGIDWRNRLDKGQESNLVAELNNLIIQTDGVIGINSLKTSISSSTRAISIQYDVQTVYTRSYRATVTAIASSIAGVQNV